MSNKLALYNILNSYEDLGSAELRASVAALANEQHDYTVCFLIHETENLDGLPNGQVIQYVSNVCTFLDYFPTDACLYPSEAIMLSKFLLGKFLCWFISN